jgi:hypothetical protein
MEDFGKSISLLQQEIDTFENYYKLIPESDHSDIANSYDGLVSRQP